MKSIFRNKRYIFFTLLALVVIGICVVPQIADARAGGGHSYSGGGRSRSSGGGGGGAELIFHLIRFAIYYPHIGIPLLIVVLIVMYFGGKEGSEQYVDHTIRKAAPIQTKQNYNKVLSKIKQRDPGFNEKDFIVRVKKAFGSIQDAWSARDLSKGQAFISDGIYERFTLQIGELKELGVIDHMEKMNIMEAVPVELESDKNFDTIHVKFKVSAVNYRKDEKTNKLIDGSKTPEVFAEVWSFVRRLGVKTSKKPGLIEGQCPSCGNPIKVGRISQCEVCQSFLRSGEYDWVLTEITQAFEWKINDSPIPGISDLVKEDPSFNTQHIEDKASVMFWRKLEAEKRNTPAFLKKIATDQCTSKLLNSAELLDAKGRVQTHTECAIGSVSVVGVEVGTPFDKTYVSVLWSGYKAYIDEKGKPVKISNRASLNTEIYILKRKHGVKGKIKDTLSASHCAACGAPEKTGMENTCEYCGTVLNDGSVDWVLEDITNRYDAKVAEFFNKSKKAVPPVMPRTAMGASNTVSDIHLLKWAVAMMVIDGEMDPKEKEMIVNLAKAQDIPTSKITQILKEFQSSKDPIAQMLEGSQDKITKTLLQKIARVALADGRLASQEVALLNKVGAEINYSPTDVKMLVQTERANMYKEAKEAIKLAKRNK